jgi:hypothetical protein
LLRDLLDVLTDGTRRAVRLHLEGRSTARGSVPRWVTVGADFEVVALREGSTVLELEAPPIGEVLASELAQLGFFGEPEGDKSAIDLLLEGLEDAVEGREQSDRFDQGLLDRLGDLDRVFDRGIEAVEVSNEREGQGHAMRIDRERLEVARDLKVRTPPSQRVRVAGHLDAIRHSDRMFALVLESGKTLRGVAEGVPHGQMAKLFGETVVVSGLAVFRPSGGVQRIEADHIEPAGSDASVWEQEPRPLLDATDRRVPLEPQGRRSGLNAVFGKWPGDETDEEITALIEEIS